MTFTPRVIVLATALTAFTAVIGLTVMHAGALGRRENARMVTAELGAVEIAAAYAPPTYQVDPTRAPQLMAGPYLHVVRAIGSSPADTPAEITASEPAVRTAADSTLLALEAPRLRPLGRTKVSALAPAPAVSAVTGAAQSRSGGCVHTAPSAVPPMALDLTLPSEGVVIRNEGSAPVSLALRRFGGSFVPIASQAAPRSAGVLSLPADHASNPWQLQITASSRLSICGLGPKP